MADYVGATEGILYPLIDNGNIDGGIFAQDTISPAVYLSTLIHQMLRQCGYRAGGDWLRGNLLRRAFLPFVGERPTGHDAQWVTDRAARAGAPEAADIRLRHGRPIDLILPLTIDNDEAAGYVDGKLNAYQAERATYACSDTMRLHVMAQVNIYGITVQGQAEIRLSVERNGVNVGDAYWSKAKYINPFGLNKIPDPLTLDVTVPVRKGDELRIRLRGNNRTLIALYNLGISRKTGEMWASFEPDPNVQQDDVWPVARNLPDLTCVDVLRSVALLCSGTFKIDDTRRTVELKTLNGITDRQQEATDLSHAVEESSEPEHSVTIEPYARRNLLKWKSGDTKGYGDGVITADAENLPAETPLFELPFAAVLESPLNVVNLGTPPLVQTRVVTGAGQSIKVDYRASPPVLLLAEPATPVTVVVNRVTDQLTVAPMPIQLTPCWWHRRPAVIRTPNNAVSLAFDRPAGLLPSGEQTIIQTHFAGLKRVLRRPRKLTIPVYLTPAEFASLDLYAPVRLQRVRAGALDLNDGYYYLNQISNYRPGLPCTLSLIAY